MIDLATRPRKVARPHFRGFAALRAWCVRGAVGLTVIGLLYLAVRNAPLPAIWAAVRRLTAWQIFVILGVEAIIYILFGGRWWLIVRGEDTKVGLLPMIGIRLAAFGISYFTIGPQVGGEPLQVLYLRDRGRATYVRAASTVVLDKLLELLVNFVLLVLGLAAIMRTGLLKGTPVVEAAGLLVIGALAAWPMIHLALLWHARYPLSAMVAHTPFLRKDGRTARFVRVAERLAGQSCRRRPRAILFAVVVSALAGASTVIEYALITSYLGIRLTFWQTVAGWGAGWLSFLTPLPAGLGALEASQVFALGRFGVPAASAIAITLVMRARDLSLASLGLLAAGNSARLFRSKRFADGVPGDAGHPVESDVVGHELRAQWKENHE